MPSPSLAKVLSYEYSGDELHTRFSKDLDSFSVSLSGMNLPQRHKIEDILISIDTFNVAHILSDPLSGDYPIIVSMISSDRT